MLTKPHRSAWRGFPDVVIAADELAVKRHADYADAKAGDRKAAYRLVFSCLTDGAVSRLAGLEHDGRALRDQRPLLISAHAEERTGRNAIPQALAIVLGRHLGWPVDEAVVQTNVVNHTGSDGFVRLARQALFDGEVPRGSFVVLVDDFVGQGGTLANLRGHIEAQGCTVAAAFALTGKPYSARLQPSPDRLHELRNKHAGLEGWWHERFGFGFDALTESEARYLERTADAHTIRDRIAAAGQGQRAT